MNRQDTYNYLMRVRHIENKILRMELRCEELRTCLDAKAIRYDKVNVQTSPTDKVSEIVSTVVDLEKEIRHLRCEKARLVNEISEAIEKLAKDSEKTVLTLYFIRRKTMEDHLSEILEASDQS